MSPPIDREPTDRETTKLLTKLGFLFLKKTGCHSIATEINVHTWLNKPNKYFFPPGENIDKALKEWEEENKNSNGHHIIDIVGVQKEYIPIEQQEITDHGRVCSRDILRGVEVKVSRSDFKNGFVHTGCHYNYLLIPKGLVQLSEVHKNVGIIEADFTCKLIKILKRFNNYEGYELPCLKIIRKPKRNNVNPIIIKQCQNMTEELTNQTKRWLIEEIDSLRKGEEKC